MIFFHLLHNKKIFNMKNKLLFFNKEGYPHNFEYDKYSGKYTGKVMFDENSDDTFKTIGLYIFEEVQPINIESNFQLNKIEIYNTSGVSFQGASSINQPIIDIKSVNSSDEFYSKWIYGKNFDTLFPKGTQISFTNISFTPNINDFGYDYYTVLENKPNAIMVITDSVNSGWTSVTYNTGGTVSSTNTVSYNDYDNTLISTITNYTLHEGKKLSIVSTENDMNEGVNSFKKSGVTSTYYQNWVMSGNSGETFKMELNLKTERPKLYQGEVNFILTGGTAYLKFKEGFNSTFNIEEGETMIFEDYDDNPILPTNPIFTIVDGVKDFDLYDDFIEFNKIIDENKTLIKNFNSKSNIVSRNTNFFRKNINFFEEFLPKEMEYNYYLKIKGSISNWILDIKIGDKIFLDAMVYDTSFKNLKREIGIKKIKTFKEIRIEYWEKKIRNNASWMNTIRLKAISNNNSINKQIYLDAKWLYDTEDNNPSSPKYIQLVDRYDYLYTDEYLLTETILNKYQIKKKIQVDEIKTLICTFSPSTITDQSFTKNVIAYDTSNIINLETEILSNSGSSNPDYTATLNAFNTKYKNELDKYGLLFYTLDDLKYNLISKYHTNLNQNNYLDTTLYINGDSGLTLTSGVTNSKVNTVLIELEQQLENYDIFPYEIEKFDKKYHSEIMLDINNNENNYGFNIELNDVNYYIDFKDNANSMNCNPTGSCNDTESTVNAFIEKYKDIFFNNGFNIMSGITTEPIYVDNYKETRINYWTKKIIDSSVWYANIKEKAIINNRTLDEQLYKDANWMYEHYDDTVGIEYQSGQTMLIIDALYSNIEVRTLNIKVNIYSEYEVLNNNNNRSLYITGNEIEITNLIDPSFFDYGLSTGMIIDIYGSIFNQNNKSYNIIGLTENVIELSYQGVFVDDICDLSINSQTFLRKPRESYNKDIYYSFRFEEPIDGQDFDKEIFFYDISGEHLKPAVDLITGEYIETTRYIGEKPLWSIDNECDDNRISLIDKPNTNLKEIKNPLKQQTVFYGSDGDYALNYLLDEYDSRTEYNFSSEPLQTFLGFNSKREGVSFAKVYMDLIDNTSFSGFSNSMQHENGVELSLDDTGLLTYYSSQIFNFQDFGFEKGQLVTLNFIDENKTGTTIFQNHGVVEIEYVAGKQIKFIQNTPFIPFYTSATTESYKYEIKVQPKNILELEVYGETEIEDERFKINLKNLGVNLNYDIEHIFKSSDIKEDGIDYKLLNKKRKEMLLMYPEIYNYIGSYKALVNAINFFGWNELELNEYYRNIKEDSDLYQKLVKVKINDIFDNTVDGWTETDLIKGSYDNKNYKKSNLFNLTYRITDEEGNNILLYSLEEMQIKLSKLKMWLTENVIPLSSNLVDISGEVQVSSSIYHNFNVSNFVKKTFSTNEAIVKRVSSSLVKEALPLVIVLVPSTTLLYRYSATVSTSLTLVEDVPPSTSEP